MKTERKKWTLLTGVIMAGFSDKEACRPLPGSEEGSRNFLAQICGKTKEAPVIKGKVSF